MLRRGYTLPEALLVVCLLGVLLAMALPMWRADRDRVAVAGASGIVVRALLDARHAAWRSGKRVAVHVDTSSAVVTVVQSTDTLGIFPLQTMFGAVISASRDSIAYAPSGLGWGASNASFVVRRGGAADTVTVSRLGRVRR